MYLYHLTNSVTINTGDPSSYMSIQRIRKNFKIHNKTRLNQYLLSTSPESLSTVSTISLLTAI